ncbi:MAG: DUF2330 domain-containing protein [Candidatus Eremiobacteraeota bacterium]|nr:DUF2330 domain-containing protein [Candidatus Eremiobacteraeota bacterium]
MIRTAVLACIMVLCFLASSPSVLADGCYYPEKAYASLPAIPSQRAMVIYQKGIERLVVESAFNGEGKSFGWIVPVPGKPLEVREVSPGFLKTLSICAQPEIVNDLTRQKSFPFLLAVLITLWLVLMGLLRPSLPGAILSLVGFVIIFAVIGPNFLRGRGGGLAPASVTIEGVAVEQEAIVGGYRVSVLDAQSLEALNRWLKTNGFTEVPQEGAAMTEDYIRQQWRFVAAVLTRDQNGLSVPHPLEISFAAASPVYPMRMTALGRSPVYLELFVIADRRAQVTPLTMELCDVLKERPANETRDSKWGIFQEKPEGKLYRMEATYQEVGHPQASSYLWDGAVLTRCAGKLAPKEMNRDLSISFEPYKPFQKKYYSVRGAKDTAMVLTLWIWCIAAPLVLFIFYGKICNAGIPILHFAKVLAPLLALCLVIPPLGPLVIPTIKTGDLGGGISLYGYYRDLSYAVEFVAGSNKKDLEIMPEAAIGKWFLPRLGEAYKDMNREKKPLVNIITGGDVREEDSPGNFTIFTSDRGVFFRLYSPSAIPFDIPIREVKGANSRRE